MGFESSAAWPINGFSLDRTTYPRGVIETIAAPAHVLTLHTGGPIEVDCKCGDARYKGVQAPGVLDFVAAGASGRWEDSAPADVFRVTITASCLGDVAASMGLTGSHARLQPQFHINDPQLRYLMLALASAADETNATSLYYVRELSRALMGRLLVGGMSTIAGAVPRQQLSSRQRRRVTELIETRLADRLELLDIAREAGMSPSHFKVLFRNTFGLPVHQYLMERRVESAARLIRNGEASIAEAAAASGFAHQSHLARWMRKSLGVTPSALARACR